MANGGALLTNYHAILHPSEPNYFALYAGSTFGISDDGTYTEPDPTLATVLQASGKTFAGYVEAGSPQRHNPWELFPEGTTVEQSFSAFPTTDFSSLPDVSFVIPNLNDDMHDGTIGEADTWLDNNISAYAQWAVTHNSLLIVTWDENDGSAGNQIPGILYGANINPGTYDTNYDHYDILASVAGSFELTAPNNGATATGLGNGIFATSLTQWMASVDIGSHPGGYQIAGTGKFTGGSGSDILWTNTSGGSMQTDIWQLGPNGQWAQSVSPGTHPSGYQVAGVGDWSGDGTDGLLWFNSTTGDTDEWQLSNGKWAGSVDLGSHPGSYQISGVGDFFDNGNDDVLWTGLNSNGSVSTDIWELNSNGKWMASVSPGVHPAGYQVAGIGDFNHDGTSDILWYDASTNDVDLWELSNGQWAGSVDIGTHPAGWTIAGVGDFNHEGTSDIVWYNATTNDVDIWEISNGHWAASADLGSHPAGWTIAGVGDFNGDGTTDILWQQTATGHTETWLLGPKLS